MSMRNYAMEDYGLVLDENIMKVICEKVFVDESIENDNCGYELYEADICNYAGSFTGELYPITDEGRDVWDRSEMIDDDCVYYIPVEKYPTLFKKAYNDIDGMIEEFREKIGEYVPDDYNYRANIRHIVGTTFS